MNQLQHCALIILVPLLFPQTASADDLEIEAWNIEWLSKLASRSGEPKNRQQKADDIAEHIQIDEVDILAVQEVCDANLNANRQNFSAGFLYTGAARETRDLPAAARHAHLSNPNQNTTN